MPPIEDDAGTRPARLVELPVGATEDRVVGSIDLEKILRDGERAYQPGLLADAHRGVLYVDEVNLLHDHLVDLLLDAAAMGRVHIERDGVSHTHPARFVLVGTMNPEEGELRPQLLDRFGLAVDVTASRDVDTRMHVVRRRLDYERDPEAFVRRYADEDSDIARSIVAARAVLDDVELGDTELRRISALCAAFDVDGMRGDLVVARTATAHAALHGRSHVTENDVRVAAELALPHRRRRDPFDAPGMSDGELDDAMQQASDNVNESAQQEESQPPPPESGPGDPDSPADPDSSPDPDSDPDGGGAPDPSREKGPSRPPSSQAAAAPGSQFGTKLLEVPGVGEGAPGRRSRSRAGHGRVVRPAPFTGTGLHLIGTLMSAAENHSRSARVRPGRPEGGRVEIAGRDLRGVVREGREGNLVVFVVDASGSMAARDRLSAVTGAVVSLLRDAYQRRDKVAVITVRGQDAEVVLPPTSSVDIAVARLQQLRTGGRTPLAQGFLTARDIVLRERVRDRSRRALMVVLTDGRATGGVDPVGRARTAAGMLAAESVASVVVDCESGMIRLGLAKDLARALHGAYVSLPELSAQHVAGVVRAAA